MRLHYDEALLINVRATRERTITRIKHRSNRSSLLPYDLVASKHVKFAPRYNNIPLRSRSALCDHKHE